MPTLRQFLAMALVVFASCALTLVGCGGGSGGGDGTTTGGDDGGSDDGGDGGDPAQDLINQLNAYRVQNGLPEIPASKSLNMVAAAHVQDLGANMPDNPAGCNLHSWSNTGTWSACCYTDDHAQAQCMWDKPRELTTYPGNGYENAGAGNATTTEAMNGWKTSPGHNDVMLNRNGWASTTWRAVGAAFTPNGYSCLWFGEEVDPVQ